LAENFVRSEFQLTAEFTDAQSGVRKAMFKDIVSMSATFALNSIPVASLVVACGYDVRDEKKPATIASALEVLKPRDKVKVTLTVRSNDGETSLMPDGRGVIFEGYYAGTGYQRSNNSASYTLHLIHWLDDLNCSSMINGNWHPGVPHDLAQAANADVAEARGGSNLNNAGVTNAVPIVDRTNSIIKQSNMRADLWEKVLKPMFKEIASFSHPREQSYAKDNNPLTNGNNAAAMAALERMPGTAPLPAKLPLFMGGVNAKAIENGANKGISLIAKSGMAYSSFWGKLVGEYAPAFLFAVSPCPEFANVIPFFGGLRGFWKEIDGREYNYANFNSSMASLIESIEIRYSQKQTSNWAVGGRGQALSYYRPWGRFPKKNKDLRGQIIVKDPPGWLAEAITQGAYAPLTTGFGQRVGDTMAPGKGPAAPPAGTLRPADTESNIEKSNLINLFCEHWYKTEVLSQRYGELSGKLRFDIAPGSIVKINKPDLATSSERAVYAAVTHVSYLINAEQHTAGTSFTLLNLRSELENNDSLFTSETPPLYPDGKWVGGPLVRGLS
jgi:hypothetical protein